MLKMAVMVSVLPIPMRSRQLQKTTTSQTALTGVCVCVLTLLQKLQKKECKRVGSLQREGHPKRTYSEKGNAASRANAQAMRALASMAEHPVKNWTSMTKNHMMVPPVLPPALKKIWATGRPVGVDMMAS